MEIKTKKKTGKKESCLFCGSTFANHWTLECHMRIHTEERPYFCRYCDATFKGLWAKISHENNIHLGIKYDCSRCGRQFGSKGALKGHQKKCKGGELGVGGKRLDAGAGKMMENLGNSDENEEDERMSYPELVCLLGLPLTLPSQLLPVREEPRWDPMFFLHMNRYKREVDECSSTLVSADDSNSEKSEVSKLPQPEVKPTGSKMDLSNKAVKPAGISKVKKGQPGKVVIKLNIPAPGRSRSTEKKKMGTDMSNCCVI